MNDIFNIHNKIAFITGGANGLGAQLVEAYSQAGCKVAFCDLKKDEIDKEIKYIKEKYKNDIIGLVCDVSNENSVKKCINEIIKKYKTIDILVNNAGVAIGGTIENYTSTQWKKLMGINVDGVFLVSKYVIPHMKKQKWGRIINVASIEAITGVKNEENARHAYNTSKGAVRGITIAMAATYAQFGIMVNSIGPGFFKTNMTQELLDRRFIIWYSMMCPVGRPGNQGEISGTVLYLSSNAVSYVTGQHILIDGGYTLV